jgi:hypothetical protein
MFMNFCEPKQVFINKIVAFFLTNYVSFTPFLVNPGIFHYCQNAF